ncbi:RagB/SusD family nutrient uptake outer membrane protein [Membranicola marinus]|uniref:RagB/SusD family nutrient uptake outer membrane protein n=1 Tax=Membranihabitans marinus TaxID=1227546 RepID=A0A953LCH5_9BACT|nr:RagB/SusD family nutrient uptake outer membrane protein [Membranihabitans marinus]MBY5959516.1 RagB/SusD family nutrient uptake outer membrane protein [Membranihabitans marinus]
MKNIKYLIVLISAAWVFTGCSESFLSLSPEGNLNEGIFFKSEDDFQQALAGAYTPLRDIANEAYLMDESRTDNARYFYYAKDRGSNNTEKMTDYLTTTDNGIILNRYRAAYVGVSRVNTILDRIDGIEFTNSAEKNQIIGEAKVLRAHYYFDLVRKFGGVPLFLNEVKNPNEAYKARATVEEVYAQVISDLKDAIGLLSNPTFSGDNIGRINKGVASTVLARVYMMRQDYPNAIPLLESVTNMGYELLPDYRSIFDPSNKGNKEMIWAVQYQAGTTGQGSEFVYDFTPIVPNTGPILGADFNNTQGGWMYPTEDLMSIFDPADARFDASIGVFEGDEDGDQNFIVTDNSLKSIVGFVPDPEKEVRYFPRKYYYPPYPEKSQGTDQNWPLYRYSDVLLMLAECYNEVGQGDPLELLNEVRARAFGDNDHNITENGQVALRGIIATERRRELAFENKRYDDLIRTGRLIPVMTAFGQEQKDKFNYLLPETYIIDEHDLLYPIPFQEMQLNDMLVQNPGY